MDCLIEKYIPHRSSMKLIESLIEVNDQMARTSVTVTEENIFYDSDIQGVYPWVGFEFMAQSIAAFASYAKKSGTKPAIGLLLSVRDLQNTITHFKLGQSLIVQVSKVHLDDDIGVFDGAIFSKHNLSLPLQTAKLNTTSPSEESIAEILRGEVVS